MASNPVTGGNNRRPRLGVTAAAANSTNSMSGQGSRNFPVDGPSRPSQADAGLSNGLRDTLKCPKCARRLEQPIYMCLLGHNLCHFCISAAVDVRCPICSSSITSQRNYALEQIATKLGMDGECPNKSYGCCYKGDSASVTKHAEFCQFQQYACPMREFDKSCEWKGMISFLKEHFEQRHAHFAKLSAGNPVTFKSLDFAKSDSNLQLFTFEGYLFVYHVRIDPVAQTASWSVQHVGGDAAAANWQYEIHVYTPREPWRKVLFIESCQPYSKSPEEAFTSGRCAVIPLKVIKNYCNQAGDLTFKFYVRNRLEKKSASTNFMV